MPNSVRLFYSLSVFISARHRWALHPCHQYSIVIPRYFPKFGTGCVHRLFRFKNYPILFCIYNFDRLSYRSSTGSGTDVCIELGGSTPIRFATGQAELFNTYSTYRKLFAGDFGNLKFKRFSWLYLPGGFNFSNT
jgi:hypothetical protein